MARIDEFLEAVRQWHKTTKPQITSFSGLLWQLAADIGCQWDYDTQPEDDAAVLRMLDDRAYQLINEQHLSEELLTAGLIAAVTAFIEKPLAQKAADIAYLEQMLQEVDEIDTILHKLAMLNNPDFNAMVKDELDSWQKIISEAATLQPCG